MMPEVKSLHLGKDFASAEGRGSYELLPKLGLQRDH